MPEDPTPQTALIRLTQTLLRIGAEIGVSVITDSGMHVTDARALQIMDAAQGGSITPGALAEHLQLSPAAVTAVLDRLEAADMIERVHDTVDRRRVLLHLTPKARMVGGQHLRPWAVAIDKAVGELDDDEAEIVARYLDLVVTRAAER